MGAGNMTLPGGVVVPVVLSIQWQNDPTGAMNTQMQLLGTQQRVMMLTQGVQMLSQVYMQLEFAQMRMMIAQDMVENAQLRLANAQDHYNESIRKYGPASAEAVRASRELEVAHNQVERATARANMMMQQQYFSIIPMGMSMVAAITDIYWALAGSKAAAGGIAGVALLAGSIAAVGALTAYQMSQVSKMSTPTMHGGGVVEETGSYWLQKGETVNASRGVMPVRGKSSTGSGGMTVNIHPPYNMDMRTFVNDFYEALERDKRRTVPQH